MKIVTEKQALFLGFALHTVNFVKPGIWHFKYYIKKDFSLCFQLHMKNTNFPRGAVCSLIYPSISYFSSIKDNVFWGEEFSFVFNMIVPLNMYLETNQFHWKSGHNISTDCSQLSIRVWRTLHSAQMLATSLKVLWLIEVKPPCITGSAHTSFHYFLHLHQLELWKAWGYSWLLKTWSTPRWCLNRAPERLHHISLTNKTFFSFINDSKIYIRCIAKASH